MLYVCVICKNPLDKCAFKREQINKTSKTGHEHEHPITLIFNIYDIRSEMQKDRLIYNPTHRYTRRLQ